MTYRKIRRSYTSTLPIMMGVIINSYPLLSGINGSTFELQSDQSRFTLNEIITDDNTFARIDDYVKDIYDIKGDFNRRINLTSDLFFFNFTQNFVEDQIDLDEDFMDVLNVVTSKIGKNEPTKLRF